MYSEWASLSPVIAANSNGSSSSVLHKFPSTAGRDVSMAVVKQLASNLGITQPPEPSCLITDEEVNTIACAFTRMQLDKWPNFLTGELVHECHLPWPLTAVERTRNNKRLRQRLLRMDDSIVSSATH